MPKEKKSFTRERPFLDLWSSGSVHFLREAFRKIAFKEEDLLLCIPRTCERERERKELNEYSPVGKEKTC